MSYYKTNLKILIISIFKLVKMSADILMEEFNFKLSVASLGGRCYMRAVVHYYLVEFLRMMESCKKQLSVLQTSLEEVRVDLPNNRWAIFREEMDAEEENEINKNISQYNVEIVKIEKNIEKLKYYHKDYRSTTGFTFIPSELRDVLVD